MVIHVVVPYFTLISRVRERTRVSHGNLLPKHISILWMNFLLSRTLYFPGCCIFHVQFLEKRKDAVLLISSDFLGSMSTDGNKTIINLDSNRIYSHVVCS